jgi:hypothetical protein
LITRFPVSDIAVSGEPNACPPPWKYRIVPARGAELRRRGPGRKRIGLRPQHHRQLRRAELDISPTPQPRCLPECHWRANRRFLCQHPAMRRGRVLLHGPGRGPAGFLGNTQRQALAPGPGATSCRLQRPLRCRLPQQRVLHGCRGPGRPGTDPDRETQQQFAGIPGKSAAGQLEAFPAQAPCTAPQSATTTPRPWS